MACLTTVCSTRAAGLGYFSRSVCEQSRNVAQVSLLQRCEEEENARR